VGARGLDLLPEETPNNTAEFEERVGAREPLTKREEEMFDVVFDMESHDLDDFLTLLLLLGHPEVRLQAVTLTPGTVYQVGLVRRALSWFERELPVGAFNLDHPKPCVSSWHSQAYGEITPSREAEPGPEVLLRCCSEATTLITGGPLRIAPESISVK
jgi:hypothetical protein